MARVGIWIVGDQVSRSASSLEGVARGTPIVFVESRKLCERRPYHWQKLVLILSAMRHFAAELKEAGHNIHYYELADDFTTALKDFAKKTKIDRLRVMEFNDMDRVKAIPQIERAIGCKIEVTPNNQFLATHDEFEEWADGRKSMVMEFWYRAMRTKLGVLLDSAGKPLGGKWNLDALNREGKLPASVRIPVPTTFPPDVITRKVIKDVHDTFGEQCFGHVDIASMEERFIWPVTPTQAEEALDDFLEHRLACFGPYEDLMTSRSWSLWHSHLSIAMNCGLLHPKKIVERTLACALPRIEAGTLPLNSVEGFIRQITGWREFIRGIYWHEMSKSDATPYTQRNELDANHPLPDFYWSGQTEMRCMAESLKPVFEYGYSHHIPRLMVMSNFALLHGISPQDVNEWFIYAFADGYEWVTTPNVVGMSLYADGGIVATKPYAAGGAYIHRMSDHCSDCRFDPKKSTGPDACPFSRAYWPFIAKHRRRLESNTRTSLAVRGLDRISDLAVRQRETRAFIDGLPVYQVNVAKSRKGK